MSAPRAVVVMYHRVGEAGARPEEAGYVLPAAVFGRQIGWLAACGRPVLPLAALLTGDRPDRAVVLTFDDGCQSDVLVAAPLLRGLGLPAAFFVNPARVGEPGRSSWDELRALAGDGFVVGSHGLDHTLLDALADHELERQLVESKRRLEDGLGRGIDALSLPGGSGGPRALRFALEAGYRLVLGSRPGLLRGPAGPAIVPRLAMRRGGGLAAFRAAVEQRPGFLLGQALRHRLTRAGRVLVGPRAYGFVRSRWLERRRPGRGD